MNYKNIVIIIFLLITSLVLIDIISDLNHSVSVQHILIECFIFFIVGGIALYSLLRILSSYQKRELSLKTTIIDITQEKEDWKLQAQTYLDGLNQAINYQFEKWGFTTSEKDIALLILKGLSHKEIANVRGTVEKTVRQQAASIYDKAGMESKSQLAAFFLDDLQPITKNN